MSLSNFSFETEAELEEPVVSRGPYEVFFAITISLVILGSLGLFLLILAKRELRQTSTNQFVLSALVPLIIAGICIEPHMLKMLVKSGEWTTGLVGCHLFILGEVLVFQAVPLTLLAISIDRCIYVWNPARYATVMRPLVAGLLIFVTWFVTIILTFAIVYGYHKPEVISYGAQYGGRYACISNTSQYSYIANMVIYGVLFGIPTLFNLIVLIAVVCRYCLLRRSLTDKTTQTEARNALLLVVIPTVAYLLLNLPTYLPYLNQLNYSNAILQWKIAKCLMLVFEAMEAFIFMVLLADVRGTISNLCCRSCRSSGEAETLRLAKPM